MLRPTIGAGRCSARDVEDRVGVFGAHRRPDRREVVRGGHACQLIRRRDDPGCGGTTRAPAGTPRSRIKTRKVALSCTSRIRASRSPTTRKVCGSPVTTGVGGYRFWVHQTFAERDLGEQVKCM